MHLEMEKVTPFMGSIADYEAADLVIIGAPMDCTASFRPGSRFGPQQIRAVSIGLEEYSPFWDKELPQSYYDWGNIPIIPGDVVHNLQNIGLAMDTIFQDKKFPLLLGGEHLVTLPAVEKALAHYPDLVVIQFDAHADLREEYLGARLSHATVLKRICELLPPNRVYQLGIRSGTKEEFAFAKANTNLYTEFSQGEMDNLLKHLIGKPVYISLDIDVVDPAFGPGTGTPEPGGCTSREILDALHMLSSLSVVGFDLVEVCPGCDCGDITSLLAAKLVREAVLGFGEKFIETKGKRKTKSPSNKQG